MPSIFNYPKFHAETALGLPLVGGKVYTYAPGTTTPKASYQDAAMAAANTNPVILDANGDAVIYLNGVYDVVLKDSSDVSQWTMSSVTGGNTSDDYEVDVLYKYGGGTTYTQAVIDLALAAVGTSTKTTLLFRPGTWVISSDANWSAYTNVVWKFAPGAIWQIATGTTTTLAGAVDIGDYQVFSCVGTGAVAGLKYVKADWFGANTSPGTTDMTTAINKAGAAVSAGGTLSFLPTTYYINTAGGVTFSSKIKIEGNGAAFTTGATVGNAPTITVAGADSVVDGIKVTGDSTGWDPTDSLSVELRRNILISGHRVKIKNLELAEGIVGIYITGNDADISNCYLHHSTVVSGYATNTNYHCAIGVSGGSRTKIHHNYVVGYGQNVLVGSDAVGVIIADNELTNADDNGVYISSATYTRVHHNKVVSADGTGIKMRGSYNVADHNEVVSPGGGAAGSGIAITGNGAPASAPTNIYNGYGNSADSNTILGTYGASAAGVSAGCQDGGYSKDTKIVNNWIKITTTGSGIEVSAGQSDGVIISGNRIEGHVVGVRVLSNYVAVAWLTGTAYKMGQFRSEAGSYYVCAVEHTSGTFATDLAAGYWVQAPGLMYHDNMNIVNNIVNGGTSYNYYISGLRYSTIALNQGKNAASTKDGLYIDYSTYNTIKDNDFSDTQTVATQRYGINEATDSNYNRYINNVLTGNVTRSVELAVSTSSMVSGQFITNTDLDATYVFTPGSADVLILAPHDDHHNVTPTTTSAWPMCTVTVSNISSTSKNLIFDPTGLNVTIAAGKSAIFAYIGSAWRQMTAVAP